MFWAQSLLAGNGAGVTCLRESRTPITTLNVATYVTPFIVRNFWQFLDRKPNQFHQIVILQYCLQCSSLCSKTQQNTAF